MTLFSWAQKLFSKTTPHKERAVLVAVVLLYYTGYFWTNLWLAAPGQQSYVPMFWLDHLTPLSPVWMYAYSAIFLAAIVPLLSVKHREVFRRTAAAYLTVQTVSYVFFLTVPVKSIMRAEQVEVNSFTTWGLRLAYWIDRPHNCFPSFHVSLALLAALCTWKVDRLTGGFALVVSLLIGASTMFVKQHYFVDVIGGMSLALLAYRLWVHPLKIDHLPVTERRFPRYASASLLVIYGLMVLGLYFSYHFGWRPWLS